MSSVEEVHEFLNRKVDLSEDFAEQGPGYVAPGVIWHGRRSAVWVAIEDVAAVLAHGGEPQAT